MHRRGGYCTAQPYMDTDCTAEWPSVESRLYRGVVKFGDFHLKRSGKDGRSRGKDEDKDGAVALECHAAVHGDFDS